MSTNNDQPETTDEGVWREGVTVAREQPISIPKGHREVLDLDHGDSIEVRVYRDRYDSEPVMTEYATIWTHTWQFQIRSGAFDDLDSDYLEADIWITKRRAADDS